MADSKEIILALKATSLNDLEIICAVKRELILKRGEIEAVNNLGGKDKALRAYAEFLTSLEMGKLGASHKRAHNKKREGYRPIGRY